MVIDDNRYWKGTNWARVRVSERQSGNGADAHTHTSRGSLVASIAFITPKRQEEPGKLDLHEDKNKNEKSENR
jgi:hypothetical protein